MDGLRRLAVGTITTEGRLVADPILLFAYIDESGDRGWGGRSTDCFVLTAVIVQQEDVAKARTFLADLRNDLGKPLGTTLHWSVNLKTHSHRKHVSDQIGSFEPLTISSVVVHKPSLMGRGSGLSDHARLYNYAIRRLLERLSWYGRDSQRELVPTFAHIKRFPYQRLTGYLELLKTESTEVNWQWLREHRIEQPQRRELLQIADLASGAIFAAVEPDGFGNFEPTYLLNLVPRLYRRKGGAISSYGLNFVAKRDHWETYSWWNDLIDRI